MITNGSRFKKIEDIHILADLLRAEGMCVDDLDCVDVLNGMYDSDDMLIGSFGLELFGGHALLRSIVVISDLRGRGIGVDLVNNALESAKEHNVRQLYLLTTTADRFFAKFGFKITDRNTAPESITSTTEFQTFCPDTAVCMKLTFKNE
ncbi:MAG: GNAT family N-acetyltransferase [Bacteroidetes bacterium]|nr:GNAT family N-acetyltransferase [Bacteroidota bacterium]